MMKMEPPTERGSGENVSSKRQRCEDEVENGTKMPQPKIYLKQIDPTHQQQQQQQQQPNADNRAGDHDLGSPVRRALFKLNRKRWLFGSKLNESWQRHSQTWDADKEFAERQVRVKTLDLFRYALLREKLAFGLGVLFMWYAASWQPISVFILAIMASLMGQYCKQTGLMLQLNNSMAADASRGGQASLNNGDNTSAAAETADSFGSLIFPTAFGVGQVGASQPSKEEIHSMMLMGGKSGSYDSYGFLAPLYSFVSPLFDSFTSPGGSSSSSSEAAAAAAMRASQKSDADNIMTDVEDIWHHESRQFLRKSFEINGSAFALALTQLAAFFVGMTLITWAAKKQASRIKILYFRSCLRQEVTWFEAIDSASGSGSSLNALVDRFEDGIGTKLALLCYFLGHVGLFALTAFSQMFNLAAFCMPFVLLVGLIIIYLSDWQAVAIGEHAMFAKRSLQLAEEIIAAIRTVFAFNGQQKEITRYTISLQPVYRKSLIKHLYTALNTSLSKFSIFACFSAYCFYAMRLFPPYSEEILDKATVLAVMRGAEVSIVNILISIPFMEALQQSKGSIARIYAAIERRSKIDPSSGRGAKPTKWEPSISFRMVQFGYADRSGPTRRRSTLPYLSLPGGCSPLLKPKLSPDPSSELQQYNYERRRSSASSVSRAQQNMMDPSGGDGDPATRSSGAHRRRSSGAGCGALPPKAAKRVTNEVDGELAASKRNAPNRRTLSHFNLDIRAGQSVALVGPSGSGKSTVLALVQRLYDINGGQLFIGQHNIKDLSVAWLRQQIGIVTQEPRLFDLTIEENIRLGLVEDDHQPACLGPSSEDRMEREARIRQQVLEAASAAGVHEFVSRLPKGYETRVGSGGVQLSGGQKQRIAIARALIRKPKILLLDESTSALDTESEAHVQAALREASLGRTTLIVAHRLSTIKHADLIVVMNQGQLVECGSHEELMRGAGSPLGIYRQMYLEQSSGVSGKDQDDQAKSAELALAPDESAAKKSSGLLGQMVEFVRGPSEEDSTTRQSSVDLGNADEGVSCAGGSEICQSDRRLSIGSQLSSQPDVQSTSEGNRPNGRMLYQFLELPKWSSIGSVLVCLVAGLILPMNLIAHSYLFSAFAYQESEQIGDYLRLFGLLILSFSSLVFIVSFLQVILPGYVGERLSTRLRIKTMDSILSKPVFYFDSDRNSPGSLCDRFNSCISNIQSLAGTRVATMLEAISTLTVGACYGFGQNLRLSLFCLGFALLVLITTIIESRIVQMESSLQQKFDAQLAHLMVDALSNIKTIASLNKEKYFIDKFSEIIGRREVGLGRHFVCLRTFLMSLKFVMPAMSWSASMYYGCHLLVDGHIDLQTVFMAFVFLPELLKARKSIESLYLMNREFSPEVLQTQTLTQQLQLQRQQQQLHTSNSASKRLGSTSGLRFIIEQTAGASSNKAANGSSKKTSCPNPLGSISFVVSQQPDHSPVDSGRRPSNHQASRLPDYMGPSGAISRLNSLIPDQSRARGLIHFKGVHFAYPQRPEAQVLQGLTFSVAPGETLALVGSSGSGKSTCAAVLEKFYDFQAGRVTIDGHDLRLLNDHWVRSQIGLVMQEPTLLSYTIGDNIRYGDNGRHVPLEEVVRAAREANIHEFIMSLPDQYDTELSGSSHSGGCQLSGGQRQRIAIARALVSNAPILIFDEATSALDSRNESLVQDALDKARRGRTSVIIAHRLASIKEADRIAVMREGQLVESGRHEDLLKIESGHYRALWLRQEGSLGNEAADQPD